MDEEIKKRFEEIEKRLDSLEDKNLDKKKETNTNGKKDFSGLAGGIRFLIKNSFLNSPNSVSEIYDELKRENYHYSKKAVEKLLSVNFMKSQRILTRVKEDKKWKYVIRK